MNSKMLPLTSIIPSVHFPAYVKYTAMSISLGILLLGYLARRVGRRKGRPHKLRKATKSHLLANPKSVEPWRNYNGDLTSAKASPSPVPLRRQGSITSEHLSTASTITLNIGDTRQNAQLSPQQLGVMGMEALETALSYWDEALKTYVTPQDPNSPVALLDANEVNFVHLLQSILDNGYNLQDDCSQLFLYENSVVFRCESKNSDRESHRKLGSGTISSADSFVSAQAEIANIHDFDEFNLELNLLPLYTSALNMVEKDGLSHRILRTEILNCTNDNDFLAKLHCVRLAFKLVFEDQQNYEWFVQVGQDIIENLIKHTNKNPLIGLAAYNELIKYSKQPKNLSLIREDLQSRGVNFFSFYDIVLDFIVLDAFEDLENPPSSVIAVVQNRWLSSAFKETALATAVWSVLKAKRRMLKNSNGFIAHFYMVTEHLIPILAWGFLGPEGNLKDVCNFFKEEVLGFLNDIYNFHTVRYTSIEDLAIDILMVAKVRYERTMDRIVS